MGIFYENYVKLCAAHNLSESGAAKKIGLSNAAANGWKNGKMPSATTQIKLANLFGISVKELMGKADAPSAGIKKDPTREDVVEDSETAELREIWSSADENERRDLLEMARMLKNRRKQNG